MCCDDQAWKREAAAEITRLRAELAKAIHQRDGYRFHLDQCEQIAGRALGYPKYVDDQKNFPGAVEEDGVCIGEHVGDTIVAELATKLTKVNSELAKARDYASQLAMNLHQKHFAADAPHWQPLLDLWGIISQIDNMTTGFVRSDDLARAREEAEMFRRALEVQSGKLQAVLHVLGVAEELAALAERRAALQPEEKT